jgi:hypothetical protein
MSTRRSEPGKPLRQERYASSAEFNHGLMGNLVARRCEVLDRAEDRDLVWFLQLLSHMAGGLRRVASELLAMFPERIGTKSMHRFGMRPGQVYNVKQMAVIRAELGEEYRGEFPLRGDPAEADFDVAELLDAVPNRKPQREPDCNPTSYPASQLREACVKGASGLHEALEEICLNPEVDLEAFLVWYFPDLDKSLREYQSRWIEERRKQTVVTKLGEQVGDAIEYALQSQRMVLVDGFARMGKTFAARAWCEQHPGCARYVQVNSSNDDIGFFRAIAKALGVSINLNSKAQELRQRVEETLQRGRLVIVLDEAHYLWPNLLAPRSLPYRIMWVMTGLVNAGVPVVLVTTPQFLKNQKAMETRTCWTSEQFTGRIGHYEKLPDSLSEADLANVARSVLPEGDAKSIELLVEYAQSSAKYLAGIDAVVCRSRFLAARAHRKEVTRVDVKQAIQQAVIPSDTALAQALAEPQPKGRGRRFNGPLTALQAPLSATDGSDAPAASEPILADRNERGVLDIRSRLRSPQADPEAVTT